MRKGWLTARLGMVSSLITSGSRGWAEYYATNGSPFIRMTNLPREGIRLDLADLRFVQLPKANSEGQRTRVQREDILVSITAELGKIGYVAFEPDRETYINQHVCLVRPKCDQVNAEFLAYFLAATDQRVRFNRLNDAGAKAGLNLKAVADFSVCFPPLAMQLKIAGILRTWDEAIEKLDHLIQLRRSYYIGLRDRMIRWTKAPRRTLRALVQPVVRQLRKPKDSYTAISIRSHGKGTFVRVVADPSTVEMEELYVARQGDLIVNITFAWEGAIALVPPEHDGYLVSHRFPTFVPKQGTVCPRYLRHAVRMPRFTYLLSLVSPGGAGRNRVLNKSDFLDLEIPSPDFGRQKEIGELLDAAENAIAVTAQYREALNRQKRGLMQKLLTGEWRVNP